MSIYDTKIPNITYKRARLGGAVDLSPTILLHLIERALGITHNFQTSYYIYTYIVCWVARWMSRLQFSCIL